MVCVQAAEKADEEPKKSRDLIALLKTAGADATLAYIPAEKHAPHQWTKDPAAYKMLLRMYEEVRCSSSHY